MGYRDTATDRGLKDGHPRVEIEDGGVVPARDVTWVLLKSEGRKIKPPAALSRIIASEIKNHPQSPLKIRASTSQLSLIDP